MHTQIQTRTQAVLKLSLTFILLIFCLIAKPSISNASAQIAVTVKNPNPYTGNQSWFVYERKPGEVIDDIATIKNYGDEAAKVTVYAVDATTNDSGSFILKFANEEQKSIGAWTELKQKEYLIHPDERIDVPFQIEIPNEASPSQYLGGIVAETGGTDTTAQKSKSSCANNQICSTSVAVKTRIGSRIYLTIPGEIKEDISWDNFVVIEKISGKTFFKFQIKNNGNVAYEPKVEIEITDLYGNLYDKFEKSLGSSLPNTTTQPMIAWDKNAPLFGNFTAKATVSFPQRFKPADLHSANFSSSKSVNFMFIPWNLIIVIFGFLLIITAIIVHRKNKIKKMLIGAEKYQVKDNEHIGDIAKNNNVHWKDLVFINKLKAPYIIKKGDIIHIPKTKK